MGNSLQKETAILSPLEAFYIKLSKSAFRQEKQSHKMKTIAKLCSMGQFQLGLSRFRDLLKIENIGIQKLPERAFSFRDGAGRGHAEWTDGKGTIYVLDNIDSWHPSVQLIELNHKYKSVLLRKSGKRNDDECIASLLELDLALLDVVEFGGGPIKEIKRFRTAYQQRLTDIYERIRLTEKIA